MYREAVQRTILILHFRTACYLTNQTNKIDYLEMNR